jgi:hypothetical protein
MDWKGIIPPKLQDDFTRQVNESVSADLMRKLLDADDNGKVVDADELEDSLTTTIQARLVDEFRNGFWPPRTMQRIGAKPVDQVEHSKWICWNCRDRNSNAFETCHKCSESRGEDSRTVPARNATAVQTVNSAVSTSFTRSQLGWTCKECGNENGGVGGECGKCHIDQDPYKRTTWPDKDAVRDSNERAELRKKLFNRIREELDMNDPFSSVEISHEEFFKCLERLKLELLEGHVATVSTPG